MPTIDFDEFLRERRAAEPAQEEVEPTLFRFAGRDWRLPDSLPAAIVLDTIRLKAAAKSDDDDASIAAMDRIGASLFGSQWQEMLVTPLADGFPIRPADIGKLVMLAIGATGAKRGDAVPNRRTRRAKASTS